jgi:hypothetical protein
MAGGRQSRKWDQAVAALLESATIAEAAAKAKISLRTLMAWLKESAFLRLYRDARRQIVEASVARLQRASGKAVRRLVHNLRCGNPAAENAAARLILDHAVGGVELLDLVQRVEELEARMTKGGAP